MKALLLAGGKGTRLWPISKANTPKQTLSPFGEDKNLLQITIERTLNIGFNPKDIYLVTAKNQENLMHPLWKPYQLGPVIAEPVAKNTAAAILLATKKLMEEGTDLGEAIYVFPTDHYIMDFEPNLLVDLHDIILCFRIVPTRAETGYGYIQAHTGGDIRKVRSFTEKPDGALATEWLQSWLENPEGVQEEKYFWNAGIYAFSLHSLGSALKKIDYDLYQTWMTLSYDELVNSYEKLPTLPIDKLIAEQAYNLHCTPLKASTWRDIGSWQSIYEALSENSGENIHLGKGILITTEGTSSCFVSSDKEYNIACAGVEDLAVVIDGNNILITNKKDPEAMQHLINKLNTQHRNLI